MFLIFSSGFFLLLSGTRGALFSLILTVLIYFINRFRLKDLSFKNISVFILVIFGMFYFADYFFISDRIFSLYELGVQDNSTAVRVSLFNYGLILLSNNIFGVSIGHFSNLYGTYPHNIIIEFGVYFGILGILLAMLIIIPCIYYVYLLFKNKQDLYSHLIALIWIYAFTNSLFSGDININSMFWNSTALLVGTINAREKSNSK